MLLKRPRVLVGMRLNMGALIMHGTAYGGKQAREVLRRLPLHTFCNV